MPGWSHMLSAPLIASIAVAAVAQDAIEPDVAVFADALRKVKIVYTADEFALGRCEVKIGKDARVIDQMMCSILSNCVAAGWSGMDRATRCVNRRVDEVERAAATGAIPKELSLPDRWLAEASQTVVAPSGGDVALTGARVRITPGEWVFTEMMVGRDNDGMIQPYMLSWRTCIAPSAEGGDLARLLAPLPFTANLHMSVSDACRRWDVRVDGAALAGTMACKTSTGASTVGRLKGRYSSGEIVLHRKRRWERPDGWAEATFDTRALRRGACSA